MCWARPNHWNARAAVGGAANAVTRPVCNEGSRSLTGRGTGLNSSFFRRPTYWVSDPQKKSFWRCRSSGVPLATSPPRWMISTRLHVADTSGRMCVLSTIVCSPRSDLIVSRISMVAGRVARKNPVASRTTSCSTTGRNSWSVRRPKARICCTSFCARSPAMRICSVCPRRTSPNGSASRTNSP